MILLVIFFGIFFRVELALSQETNSIFLKETTAPKARQTFAFVSNIAETTEVQLFINGKFKRSFMPLGSKALISLGKSTTVRNIQLKFVRQNHSSIPFTAKAKVHSFTKDFSPRLLTVYQELLKEYSSHKTISTGLLTEAKTILLTVNKVSIEHAALQNFYLSYLLKREMFAEVLGYALAKSGNRSLSSLSATDIDTDVALALSSSLVIINPDNTAENFISETIEQLRREEQSPWREFRLARLKKLRSTVLVLRGMNLGNQKLMEVGYKQLIKLKKIFSELGDYRSIASTLNSLVPYYFYNGQPEKAHSALEEALKISKKGNFPYEFAVSSGNLSVLYRRQGQYHKALTVLRAALDFQVNFETSEPTNSLNLADLYIHLGKPRLASINAKTAKKMFSETGDKTSEFQACLVEARAYSNLKQHTKSRATNESCLRKILSIVASNKPGMQENLWDLSTAYYQLAESEFALGNVDLATDLLERGRVSFFGTKPLMELPLEILGGHGLNILLLRANIALEAEEFETVKKLLSTTDSLLAQEPSETKFLSQRIELVSLKMRSLIKTGNIEDTYAHVESVFSLSDKLRTKLDFQYLGPAWSAKIAISLNQYIEAIVSSKAFTNDQQLQNYIFYVTERLSGTEVYAGRNAREFIANHEHAQNKVIASAEKDAWLAATEKDTRQKDNALMRNMNSRNRLITQTTSYKLRETTDSRSLLSISELMQTLSYDEVAIKFYTAGDTTLIYVMNQRDWKLITQPTKNGLAERASEIAKNISKIGSAKANKSITTEELFRDAEEMIKSASKIVYTSNKLFSEFPLGLVSSSTERATPIAANKQIVSSFSLSDYYSSASIVYETNSPNTDIAVFADPNFSSSKFENVAGSRGSLRSWSQDLRRLPWTSREAQNIKRQFPEKVVQTYLNEDATRANLLSSSVRNAKVLHIATHGYFNPETPDIVGLATTKTDDDDTGFLTLSSLFSKRFRSNLIVISGCETALGDDLGAEGQNSLARSFITNGAGSVIGTLWKVPDRPTSQFMGHFYSALRKHNGDAAKALSMAQNTMMSSGQFKHPYYWAGFVLTSANHRFNNQVL